MLVYLKMSDLILCVDSNWANQRKAIKTIKE